MKLGNAVEKFTKYTGIQRLVKQWKKLTGRDCGCEKRKEKMNNWSLREWLKNSDDD